MSLKSRAARGVVGFGAVGVVRYGVSFAVQIAFAQLLSPQVFGVVALSTTLITFVGLLGRWGVDEAVMQDIDIEHVYSTIFWLRVAFAACMILLVVLISPLGKLFYDPIVISALIVFAFSKATSIAVSPLRSVINREFQLSKLALGKFAALLISAIVGLGLVVYQDETVWGLIAFYVIKDVLTAVFIVVMAPKYPRVQFNPDAARWFARFARDMWLSKVSGTAENQLDDYLIGTIGGTVILGGYSIAWRLTNAYTTVFQTAITKGILPTFSQLKGHERKSREGMEFLLRVQSYVVVPLYVFVSLNATDIVVLTFGGHWEATGEVLRILAIAGILYPIVNTIRQYYYSVGRTSIILRVNALILVGMLLTIPVGVIWYGGVGAAVAMTLVEVAALVAFMYGLRSGLGVSIRETFAPALFAGFVTVVSALGVITTMTGLGGLESLIILEPLHRQLVTIAVSGTAIAAVFYGTLTLVATSTVTNDISVVVKAITGNDEE